MSMASRCAFTRSAVYKFVTLVIDQLGCSVTSCNHQLHIVHTQMLIDPALIFLLAEKEIMGGFTCVLTYHNTTGQLISPGLCCCRIVVIHRAHDAVNITIASSCRIHAARPAWQSLTARQELQLYNARICTIHVRNTMAGQAFNKLGVIGIRIMELPRPRCYKSCVVQLSCGLVHGPLLTERGRSMTHPSVVRFKMHR